MARYQILLRSVSAANGSSIAYIPVISQRPCRHVEQALTHRRIRVLPALVVKTHTASPLHRFSMAS